MAATPRRTILKWYHQGRISIVPTPSSVSFTLMSPSHYSFSDVEYSSTHLGTPSSLSRTPKSSPLRQENNYRTQKLTSENQSVHNTSSPWEDLGEYDQTSSLSIFSNHPCLWSPQHTIARVPTSSKSYRTAPPHEGAEDTDTMTTFTHLRPAHTVDN